MLRLFYYCEYLKFKVGLFRLEADEKAFEKSLSGKKDMKNHSQSSIVEKQQVSLESNGNKKANTWSFLWRSFLLLILLSAFFGVIYNIGSLIVKADAVATIQYRKTIIFLLVGVIFLRLALLYRKNKIRPLFSKKLDVRHQQWCFLNALMAALFLSLSVLNLFIALAFSEEIWVTYKLFSGLFVYVAICIISIIVSKKQ